MNRRLTVLLSLLLAALAGQAQTLTGRLVDEQNMPVEFANIVLQTTDSSFVAGTVSDVEGRFTLANDGRGTRIHISYVGYLPLYKAVTGPDLGTLQLTPDAQVLGEVVVKGDLPKTQLKGDALVTNIQNSVLSKAGSANDVLGKIPGIIQKDGAIEVFGKGTAVVYINGRRVRNASELEQLNSDEIKHVEVIQNPGARYDATVKAVVRIQTIRRKGDGFGFNLRSSYYLSDASDLIEQANLNYRHNGLDLFATAYYSRLKWMQLADMTQRLQGDQLLELKQDADFGGTIQNLLATLGVNYQLDDNHSMGIKYRPNIPLSNKGANDITSDATLNGTPDDHLHTLSHSDTDSDLSHQLNLYYNGNVGKLNIDLNVDWLHNGSTERTHYNEQSSQSQDREVHTLSRVKNRLGAGKLVVSHPLWGGSLSAGTEYTYTYRKDDYLNEEDYVPTAYSKIKESNATAFAEYTHPLPFGNLAAGVRYEHVTFDYYENDTYRADQSRTYDNWFPNVSLSAQIGKMQTQLSYTVKTARPSYHQLGNATLYVDRYCYSKGNPTLRPQTNHDLTLLTSWKNLQFVASYQVQQKNIINWQEPLSDRPNTIVLHFVNYPKDIPSLCLMLSAAPKVGRWSPRLTAGLIKQWLTVESEGRSLAMNKAIPYLSLGNTLELPKGFLLNLDFNYTGYGCQEIYTLKAMHKLDLSLRKSFLNEALSVELRGTDLFKGQGESIGMYAGDYTLFQSNERDSREFSLTLRYKFNTVKSKYRGTGAGESQKSRM